MLKLQKHKPNRTGAHAKNTHALTGERNKQHFLLLDLSFWFGPFKHQKMLVCSHRHAPLISMHFLSSSSSALCLSSSSSCRDLSEKNQTPAESCHHHILPRCCTLLWGHKTKGPTVRKIGCWPTEIRQEQQCFGGKCYGLWGLTESLFLCTEATLCSLQDYTGFYIGSLPLSFFFLKIYKGALTPPWGQTPRKPMRSSHELVGSSAQSFQTSLQCLEFKSKKHVLLICVA